MKEERLNEGAVVTFLIRSNRSNETGIVEENHRDDDVNEKKINEVDDADPA